MPWAKGQSGNAGGRATSRSNRAREAIIRVVDEQSDKIAGWFEGLEEAEGKGAAIKAFVALAEFALPKLARTEISGDLNISKLTDAELDAQVAAAAASLGFVRKDVS